jgi:hypothetical protein
MSMAKVGKTLPMLEDRPLSRRQTPPGRSSYWEFESDMNGVSTGEEIAPPSY